MSLIFTLLKTQTNISIESVDGADALSFSYFVSLIFICLYPNLIAERKDIINLFLCVCVCASYCTYAYCVCSTSTFAVLIVKLY